MNVFLIAAGGAMGSLSRYAVGQKIAQKYRTGFPAGTFLVNLTGAILLGMIHSAGWGGNLYALFGDGFLGAFTTFSTFMYEGFNLFQDNKKKNAVVYISASVLLGIAGFVLGAALMH